MHDKHSVRFSFLYIILLLLLVWTLPEFLLYEQQDDYTDFNISYIETSGTTTFDDILESDFENKLANAFALGYKKETVWFKIEIHNPAQQPKEMVLELTEMFYHTVDLYTLEDRQVHVEKNGLNVPIDERNIKEMNPAFKLAFKPMETKVLYLKVRSTYSFFGAFELSSPDDFKKKTLIENNKYIFYFGAVLIIALYNLFIYLYLREKIYLYYLAFVFSFAVWVSLYRGLAFYFIDREIYDLLQLSIPLFFIMLMMFSKEVLHTDKMAPIINKMISLFIVILVLCSFLMLYSLHEGYLFMNYSVIPILPFLILLALYATIQGSNSARLYLLAMLIFFPGMGMVTCLALGEIGYSNTIRNAPVVGSMFEVILFSLLLAYRINKLKEKRLASKEELLKQKMTESSRLFHTVAEKTQELTRINRKLKQELAKSKKLEEELKYQATTDPLTNLLNRRAFFTAADAEIEKAKRYKHSLSYLILDIDKFKTINDTYGHDMGDIVIQMIARLMRENTRSVDYTGRIGGEEFAVIMPSTDLKRAFDIADRLRAKIADMPINIDHTVIHITVSIGISDFQEKDSTIPKSFFKRADNALYRAKNSGRNRVCTSSNCF